MKLQYAQLSMTQEDTNDAKRNFQVTCNNKEWVKIGSGYQCDQKIIYIHKDDIEKFIEAIQQVVHAKLPTL